MPLSLAGARVAVLARAKARPLGKFSGDLFGPSKDALGSVDSEGWRQLRFRPRLQPCRTALIVPKLLVLTAAVKSPWAVS